MLWVSRNLRAPWSRSFRLLIQRAELTWSRSALLCPAAVSRSSVPAFTVKARFITGQTPAITIPRKAVVERGQLTSVFVVDQSGIARMRLVKTGKTYSDRVEVLSGLKEGEQIVVDAWQT